MKVLVVGGGGREHALCWHLATRSSASEVYCTPGSDGIAQHATCLGIAATDLDGVCREALALGIDLVVVGPEQPLTAGLVDRLQELGVPTYGPCADAARLEGSKVFAKRLMERCGVPTARFEIAVDIDSVRAAAERLGLPLALKADGLAAGKGVLLVRTDDELEDALRVFFAEQRFGAAAHEIVVEEMLQGEEVSFIALCDGERFLPFATSKDYKRIGDGDTGGNTGGMGAHSPSGLTDAAIAAQIEELVLRPTVDGLRASGTPFVGVLYAGLMLTDAGIKVLEFNVRLGDPEAQALLLRLEDDLATLLHAGATGGFQQDSLRFSPDPAVCLVLAAEDYPDAPRTGVVIEGLDRESPAQVQVFHAGTRHRDGDFVVAGGRTLNVCATGHDLGAALDRAYAFADGIRWPGRQLRTDIGARVRSSGAWESV